MEGSLKARSFEHRRLCSTTSEGVRDVHIDNPEPHRECGHWPYNLFLHNLSFGLTNNCSRKFMDFSKPGHHIVQTLCSVPKLLEYKLLGISNW